jgi:caa(3)-type oxidase subunit IV
MATHAEPAGHGDATHLGHETAVRTYYLVYAALFVLTFLTVGASFIHMGTGHTIVGLAFGVIKASLVVLIFMHVAHSSRLIWVSALAGVFWLHIMITLTVMDYLTRHWDVY